MPSRVSHYLCFPSPVNDPPGILLASSATNRRPMLEVPLRLPSHYFLTWQRHTSPLYSTLDSKVKLND